MKMDLNNFFHKKIDKFLSIDFGQLFIKIVYMESGEGNYRIINYGIKNRPELSEGRKEIVSFIKGFIETNSIPAREAYLTISDVDSVLIKNLILPDIPKGEIPDAIRWQIKEEFLLDPGSYTLDWQNVREYTDEEGIKKKEVLFIAVKKETIDGYLSVCSECSLNIIGVSDGPFNYANILRRYSEQEQNIAVMDIGYNDTIICIYNNCRLGFIRRLTFSADKLTQALTKTLISGKGRLLLSHEEAENLKIRYGIPQDSGLLLDNDIPASNVIALIRPLLENLVRELKYSFDYFVTIPNNQYPSVLYLAGGGANTKNLDTYLKEELKINVRNLPLPESVTSGRIDKTMLDQDLSQIINAVGAGLATEVNIKFIPPEVKIQKIEFLEKISLRLVTFTVAAILLLSFIMVQLQIRNYKIRMRYAQNYLNTMGEIRVLDEAVNPMEEAASAITRGKVPAERLLKIVGSLLPQQTVLDELSLDQESHSLELKGRVLAPGKDKASSLERLMNNITVSPFFLDAQLVYSKAKADSLEFDIDCSLSNE